MKWTDGQTRAFLSHTHAHAKFVSQLSSALGDWGVQGFVAHAHIDSGAVWRAEIREALGAAEFLVAFLTEDWLNSDWTDQEVGFALGRGIPVVAVMAGATPHGFLSDRQGIPHPDDERAPALATKIIQALQVMDPRFGGMVLSRALLNAGSFDGARDVVRALLEVKYADQDIVALAERAAKENFQVSGLAWGRAAERDQALAHLRKLAVKG